LFSEAKSCANLLRNIPEKNTLDVNTASTGLFHQQMADNLPKGQKHDRNTFGVNEESAIKHKNPCSLGHRGEE
jgi:hypothetical protein